MGWRIQTFFYLIGLCIIHFLPSCLFNQNGEKEYTAREREQKKKKWKRSVILSVTRFFNLPIWAWASSNYSMKMNRKKSYFVYLFFVFFRHALNFSRFFTSIRRCLQLCIFCSPVKIQQHHMERVSANETAITQKLEEKKNINKQIK